MADNPGKNDIDFDELDKAVNSLMGKVGEETLDDDAKTKTLEVTTTLKPEDKVKYDEIGKVAEKIGDETLVTDGEVELVEDLSKLPEKMELPVTAAATPPAAPAAPVVAAKPAVPRPNSGRFMDMVHPKGDMRTPSATPAPASTPSPSMAAPSAPVVTITPPETLSQPAAPVVTPSVEAPLTPFLPDAKVEKRPLGGGEALAVPVTPGSPKHAGAQPPESVSFASADTSATEVTQVDNQLPPSPAEQPTADGLAEQTLAKLEASEVAAPVEQMAEDAPSIEKVESGDTEGLKNNGAAEKSPELTETPGGAIYDVQPLNHPAKKKSGWGVVLIIVIIIVLSIAVAGGAYLYFVARP